MALEGNLNDFALSEILQLISVQQKSGYLELRSGNDRAEIWFEKGRIVFADQQLKPLTSLIKEHLINTKVLTPDIISRVENAAQQSRISFEKVLVSGGYLGADELAAVSEFIISEMIHGLFKWQEGTYKFDADVTRPSSPADVSLKTEGLLMEGMRRIDEWPGILEQLPSPKMWVHPGTANPDDYSLTEEEQKIIELAQNGIRLADLVNQAGIGQYRTYETVCNLKEVDLLTVSEPTIDTEETKKQIKRRIHVGRFLRPLLAFVVVVLLIAVALTAILGARWGLKQIGFSKISNAAAKRANMQQEMESIRLALDVYLIQYHYYPAELEDLVAVNLLSPDQIRDDFREQIYGYRLTNGNRSYEIDSRYLDPQFYYPQ
ncbi:MAG: DUF4388 domain-containing protein [Gemmatimonadetes bacterium]|nr:MAG: DUF4388 domain-containing protein [Gemmatimonadota bacterium]